LSPPAAAAGRPTESCSLFATHMDDGGRLPIAAAPFVILLARRRAIGPRENVAMQPRSLRTMVT